MVHKISSQMIDGVAEGQNLKENEPVRSEPGKLNPVFCSNSWPEARFVQQIGGTLKDNRDPEDHGSMYGQSVEDLDGHIYIVDG